MLGHHIQLIDHNVINFYLLVSPEVEVQAHFLTGVWSIGSLLVISLKFGSHYRDGLISIGSPAILRENCLPTCKIGPNEQVLPLCS